MKKNAKNAKNAEHVRAILNSLFAIQLTDGWPADEGLRGLKPGKPLFSQATWGDWPGEFDVMPAEYLNLDGAYTVQRRGRTYRVRVAGDDFHITRIA